MKELLKKFEAKSPEIVFEWHDSETEARGWVVINSLRNGAAGGGTRMRRGLDRREVESLAKTMEIKFTVSGPPIGGAKSGINFDPSDPRKHGVLQRWYRAVFPLLKNYYGTGGDLNVDELDEVIPMTENLGLWHPQEGIVNGHYQASKAAKIKKIGQLRQGVSKVIEDWNYTPTSTQNVRRYTVSDLITGYGVAEAVRHYYDLWGGSLANKRVIVQGWGNVGSAAALKLAKEGARVVGIIDRNGGIIAPEGLSLEEVKQLYFNKQGNTLVAPNLIPFDEINQQIWQLPAEVFVPAAASRLITQAQISSLIEHGLEVVSCGANVPFADPDIFYGPISEYTDQRVALLPDFVANCGMARVFAYFMQDNADITDQAIFEDVSATIRRSLSKAHQHNPQTTQIATALYRLALHDIA